jgi:hypothetical protein
MKAAPAISAPELVRRDLREIDFCDIASSLFVAVRRPIPATGTQPNQRFCPMNEFSFHRKNYILGRMARGNFRNAAGFAMSCREESEKSG